MSEAAANNEMRFAWLGRLAYSNAYQLQLALMDRRQKDEIPDTALFLEHPHVYTLGRRGDDADILASADELERSGAEVIHTDRGGQTTYHGPGQLVAYPILDLKRGNRGPVEYVRSLEQAIIRVIGEYGIEGHLIAGKTGVWTYGSMRPDMAAPLVNEAKIAAIGVRISRGVSMHGFALNVNTDLGYYANIVPCGMPEVEMASTQSITGETLEIPDVANLAAKHLADELNAIAVRVEPQEIHPFNEFP